ncbi:MAG: hypothetical protein R3B09_18570 [Nannocystaceae bacterium]
MITIHEFDRQIFGEDFSATNSAPVEYLWTYLHELGARTCLREAEYVDRHYLSDFSVYYSRSFRTPSPKCRRIHYFSLEKSQLNTLIEQMYGIEDEKREAEKLLGETYLGFVVRRPIRGAAIGRTVLRTYPEDGGNGRRRLFTAARTYHVHIGGLRLSIDGLAFQQQDVGAAVCASTSLWCALQKVAVLSGARTPTPNQITTASQSPFPVSFGLDVTQMAMALSNLGYTADSFSPDHDFANFRAKVGVCLQSQLPVILILRGAKSGHTVTVTGYSAPSSPDVVAPMRGEPGILMRAGAISTLYVHDDNLGPHAHYELLSEPPEEFEDECYSFCDSPESQCWLLRGIAAGAHGANIGWDVDCLQVEAAIVPKPSKIRMPVNDLIEAAWSFRHLLEAVFEEATLVYECRFSTGVEYRKSLLRMGFSRVHLRDFDFALLLPRHVAIVSVFLEQSVERGSHLCDLLIDATAVDLCPSEESLLAIVAPGVPSGSVAWERIHSICVEYEIQMLSASPGAHADA